MEDKGFKNIMTYLDGSQTALNTENHDKPWPG